MWWLKCWDKITCPKLTRGLFKYMNVVKHLRLMHRDDKTREIAYNKFKHGNPLPCGVKFD